MKVPYLKKKPEIKSCHNIEWEDNYSWIHQKNILEVLRDKTKLDPEVKKYLDEENSYTNYYLKDTKDLQKRLFDEIKGRIKLDDESLPYKDHTYEYWSKTTATGNYSIKLRKKINTDLVEEIWNGDEEKKKLKTCHNIEWEDNYSWIHQKNILEVLRDKKKLDPEVKKYLDEENSYAENHLKNTKKLQKNFI
jgi:protease II